jgi:predicted secreted protein
MRLLCIIVCCVTVLIISCNSPTGSKEPELKKDDTLSQIRPEKPVRIKFRHKDGSEYSWEIQGDRAEKIIEADKVLRIYTTNSKEEK